MSGEFSNDNDVVATAARETEANGQAAMLLVESLIHGLIERKVISVADAVEIVETAREVQVDAGVELDSHPTTQRSITLLQAISTSLKGDLPET
jgi:hypothetical protein